MPTGAPPRARRRYLPPPVWRFAPRRLLHDVVTLTLMLGVLTMLSVAAAAGPLYAEAVSDAAVRLALESVPAGAAAKTAPVVRLNGGIDPETRQWTDMLRSLEEIPGVGPARVTTQTISTELHPTVFFDPVGPVVTGDAGSAPVRLFGVDDPAARLVVVTRAPGAGEGVWLPEPVARSTGVAAGDEVQVQLSGLPDAVPTTTRVLGTYAVQPDGRTPQSPPGERLWADLGVEAFPSDAREPTQRAHLAVADLATTAALAKRTGDELLWSAQARLSDATPRLAQFHRTADAVSLLRRLLTARSELADDPVGLRPSIVSGVEDLADRADVLSSAAQRGAAVTTRVGIALSLALVVAAAGYSMGRRRREVQLAAGSGRRPVSAGVLYAAELLPVAVVAGVVGWFAARGVVAVTVGTSSPTRSVLRSAGLWSAGALVAAVVASAAVAAVANRVETRRLEGRPEVRPPWVLVLVVVAASATVGLLTRPPDAADTLGPLDLLVPPLVVAAVAAVGARFFFAALRRARTASRPPSRRTVVSWLARRRLQAPDRGREGATTIAATGLAMLAFSLASLASLHSTVEDRAAVAAGAATVNRVESSWQLTPTWPSRPWSRRTAARSRSADIPVARNPPLPEGQSTVWRTSTSVATSEEGVNLLIVDPARFASSAAWGTPGGPVAAGRALLPALAADDAETAAAIRRNGVSSPGAGAARRGRRRPRPRRRLPDHHRHAERPGAAGGARRPRRLPRCRHRAAHARGARRQLLRLPVQQRPAAAPRPRHPPQPTGRVPDLPLVRLGGRGRRDHGRPRRDPRPHRHPRAGARDAGLRRRGPGPPLPDRPRAGLRGGRGRRGRTRRGAAGPSVAGRRPDARVDGRGPARSGPGPRRGGRRRARAELWPGGAVAAGPAAAGAPPPRAGRRTRPEAVLVVPGSVCSPRRVAGVAALAAWPAWCWRPRPSRRWRCSVARTGPVLLSPNGSGSAATVSGLVKIYPTATGETHALRGVDAEFHEHTVTALTGPSGSGKSTLLALLALRDRPSGGDVTILGRNASSLRTRERRRHSRRVIAWVPQRPTDGVYPHLTAAQNVEQAARWRGAPSGAEHGLLERLGLERVAGVRHPACPVGSSSGSRWRAPAWVRRG